MASREKLTETGSHQSALSLRELVAGPYLLPLLGLITFYALVNIVANTKGQFGTFLYVNVAGSTVAVASAISVITQCLGVLLAVWFMRIVDGRNRLRWYLFGATCYVLAMAIVAVFGVTVWSLATSAIFSAIGGALAFEAMLKIWSQEAFPTLLRATAQGTIVGAARVVAAIAAVATPTLMTNAPRATFAVLLGVVSAGLIAGLFVGRTVQRHNHLRDDDTNAQVKGERNIEELT